MFFYTIIMLVRGMAALRVKLNVECLHAPHRVIGKQRIGPHFAAVPQDYVCLVRASNGVFRLRFLQERGQRCFQPRGDLPEGRHRWDRLAAFDLA